MGTCSNCRQERGRLVKGRCQTCYRFHRRTGRERDAQRVLTTNGLRLERAQSNMYLIRLAYQIACQA